MNPATGDVVEKDVPNTVALLIQLHSASNAAATSDIFGRIQKANSEQLRKIAGYIEVRWESLSNKTDAVVDRYRSMMESSSHGTMCWFVPPDVFRGCLHGHIDSQ